MGLVITVEEVRNGEKSNLLVGRADAAPAMLTYISPFTLIVKEEEKEWSATLDEVNLCCYDYVKLNRLSTSLDIGLGLPLCLHFGFDGSLVLPILPSLSPVESAVNAFNQQLGTLLMGGLFCEAISSKDVEHGFLYTTGYVRTSWRAKSFNGQLHALLRSRSAPLVFAICLHRPKKITVIELHKAIKKGARILAKLPFLSVPFVLHGVSAFVANDWASCLSNCWVGIEQTLTHLWSQLVSAELNAAKIDGRRQLLRDVRSWTTALRAELLFQKNIIDIKTYGYFMHARKARNKLVHEGELPGRYSAESALHSLFRLMSLIYSGNAESLEALVSSYIQKNMEDKESKRNNELSKYQGRPVKEVEGYAWFGPLPPLPGEKEWGDKPFEQVYPKGE